MTDRARSQGWILDIALSLGGYDALHPEAKPTLEECGHNHSDFDKVFELVKSGVMMPKAWSTIAAQAEERARHYDREGFAATAKDFYQRAAVMWGRAQYSFYQDDPRKLLFRERCNECVAAISRLSDQTIQRVELEFEGKKIYAILFLPSGDVKNAPAVILGPGMDMIKEDYIQIAQRYYTSRGMVALSIEGPGQGESVASGLKVTLTNYERAISRYIDYLQGLPQVDPERIGMFGVSMGAYWGLRGAAHDPRLHSLATFMSSPGEIGDSFSKAQPNFKANHMYMTGYTDEEAYDSEIISNFPIWDLASKVKCPVLIGNGEFDELIRVEDILSFYELIEAPKEIRIYENEFHPLGGVAAEMFRYGADWSLKALNGGFAEGSDKRYYAHVDGRITEGEAQPVWWLGAQPPEVQARKKRVTV
jgi:Dipeptidyl aminopeptidases/acylaminoacyl-peptidases